MILTGVCMDSLILNIFCLGLYLNAQSIIYQMNRIYLQVLKINVKMIDNIKIGGIWKGSYIRGDKKNDVTSVLCGDDVVFNSRTFVFCFVSIFFMTMESRQTLITITLFGVIELTHYLFLTRDHSFRT